MYGLKAHIKLGFDKFFSIEVLKKVFKITNSFQIFSILDKKDYCIVAENVQKYNHFVKREKLFLKN